MYEIFFEFYYQRCNLGSVIMYSLFYYMVLFSVSTSTSENEFKHIIPLRSNNSTEKFAVLQSVADFQPDVDAIYRLTRTTPFDFKRPQPFVPAKVVQTGRNETTNIT